MHVSSLGLAISVALGGLGVFLLSVKLLSNGLKSISGDKLRMVLKKFTKTNFHSLLFGVVFTTMIQSSDGSVALVISLVAAGFLPLRSALAFVLGANIGTATTSIIVSVASNFAFTQYFMIFAFIGGMAYLLVKEKEKANVAMIIASIGMLFLGLKVMSSGMHYIAGQDAFKSIVGSVGKNSWLSAITSFGMTGIMQSSSASVSVAQQIYQSSDQMSLLGGIGFVIGANIGTTVTAFLTTTGGNKDTKRIAVFWMITNLSMALIFLPLSAYYSDLIQLIVPNHVVEHVAADGTITYGYNNFEMAIAHVMFNVFLVVVFFPIIKHVERLIMIIVKEDSEVEFKYDANLPVNLISESPQLALEAANSAFYTIGEMNLDTFRSIEKFLKTKNRKYLSRTEKLNIAISEARKGLYDFIAILNTRPLSASESSRTMKLVMASRSQERVSEHLISIEEMIAKTYNKKTKYFDISPTAFIEIATAITFTKNVQKRLIEQSHSYSAKRSSEIKLVCGELNEFLDVSIENHENRVKNGECIGKRMDFHKLMNTLGRISNQQLKASKYFAKRKNKRTAMKSTQTERLQAIFKEE